MLISGTELEDCQKERYHVTEVLGMLREYVTSLFFRPFVKNEEI